MGTRADSLATRNKLYKTLLENPSGMKETLRKQAGLDPLVFDNLYDEISRQFLCNRGGSYSVTKEGKEQMSSYVTVYGL